MTSDEKTPEGFSLKRWSRVKREARRDVAPPGATAPANATVVPANAGTQRLSTNVTGSPPAIRSGAGSARDRQDSVPATPVAANAADLVASPPDAAPAELPPIESLTIDSDFTAFLQPKVNEALKRKALKKLFGDPHFNVMDRLDVYIDDYSQPDPLAPEVARQLVQARAILDARPTRINAQGILEGVPEPEMPVAPVAQETARSEPAIAEPAATNATPPAPEADAGPPARAVEKAASTDLAPGGDPKAGADSR